MKPLFLLLALAAPALAQVVPDEFPEPTEPFGDRSNRELVERHRAFLSGLFASTAFAVGPQVGQPFLYGAATVDGGYRFQSGDALAVHTTLQSPLDRSALSGAATGRISGTLGAEAILGLRRFAASGSPLERAEVGVGLGVSVYEAAEDSRVGSLVLPSVSVTPRVTVPITPVLSMSVGLRLSQEIGADAQRGPFVGLSVGLRRIWADEARMVLD